MRLGGISDPRNKILLKMFNMVDVGERAGSGVPNIFNIWEDEGWVEPMIEEQFNPDRTILTLEFKKKQAKKKTSDKKQAKKTIENMEKIRKYLREHGESKTNDIADYIELSPARTRAMLAEMGDVKSRGGNSNRRYMLKSD